MTLEKGGDIFNSISHAPQHPNRYGEVIYAFNMLIHVELQNALDRVGDSLVGVEALAIPGSDGRFEKGSLMSQVEIIALLPEHVQNLDELKNRVDAAIQKASPTRIAHIEWKQFGTSLAAFNGDTNRIQPARVATDARLVWGKQSSLDQARKDLGAEILSADGRRIKEKVTGLERDAKLVTASGRNKISGVDAVHFELENSDGTGAVFFNPSSRQLSFKVGPLRLVQNTILAESIKHTRRENDAEFVSTLRSNISRRLQQLSNDKMLNHSPASVQTIIDHYNFFLRHYHRSEQAYLKTKQTVVALDASEVLEIKRRITDLAQLMSSLKIGRTH